MKYGVTSGLTWDFTVNTDFSQVEADEQQVNLTRFSLFFPEKRDFFLENSGIFQFGVGNGGGGGGGGGGRQNPSQDMILFFSRQIGLSDDGNAIPILGGTRLTGRAGGLLDRRAEHPAARREPRTTSTSPVDQLHGAAAAPRRARAVRHRRHVAQQGRERRALQPRRRARTRTSASSRTWTSTSPARRRSRRPKPCRARATTGTRSRASTIRTNRLETARRLSDDRRAVQQRDGLRPAPRRQQRRAARRRALPAGVVVDARLAARNLSALAGRELHAA